MRNVSAETKMSFCEHKMWSAHAPESNHDLKCESNPLPLQLPLISKIDRPSLINIESLPIPGARARDSLKKKKTPKNDVVRMLGNNLSP